MLLPLPTRDEIIPALRDSDIPLATMADWYDHGVSTFSRYLADLFPECEPNGGGLASVRNIRYFLRTGQRGEAPGGWSTRLKP